MGDNAVTNDDGWKELPLEVNGDLFDPPSTEGAVEAGPAPSSPEERKRFQPVLADAPPPRQNRETILPTIQIEGDPEPVNTDPNRELTSIPEAVARGAGDMASVGFDNEASGAGGALNDWHEQLTSGAMSLLPQGVSDAIGYDPVEHTQTAGRGMDAPVMNPLQRLGKAYRGGSDSYLADNKQALHDRSTSYRIGEGIGLAGTAAAPIGKMLGVGKIAPKLVAPVAEAAADVARPALERAWQFTKAAMPAGAGYGGLGALGTSEATGPLDMAYDVGKGVVVGAAAAPLVGGAVHGVVEGAKAVPGALKALGKYVGNKASDWGASLHGMTMPTELAQAGKQLVANTPEAKTMRADALAGEEGAGITELADDITGLSRTTDKIKNRANISEKPLPIQEAISGDWKTLLDSNGGDPRAINQLQQEMAHDSLSTIKETHDWLRTYHNGAPAARKLDKILEEIKPQLASASRSATPEASQKMFIGLDRLKRGIGELIDSQDNGVSSAALELYEPLRANLERADVWGEGAAAIQRETNAARTREITARQAGYNSKFMTPSPTERVADNTEGLMVADTSKVGGFARGLGTEESKTNDELLRAGVKASADLGDSLARHYNLPPDMQAEAAKGLQFATGIDKRLDQTTREATSARALKDLAKHSHDQSIGKVLGFVHPAKIARGRAVAEREMARRAESAAPPPAFPPPPIPGTAEAAAGAVPKPNRADYPSMNEYMTALTEWRQNQPAPTPIIDSIHTQIDPAKPVTQGARGRFQRAEPFPLEVDVAPPISMNDVMDPEAAWRDTPGAQRMTDVPQPPQNPLSFLAQRGQQTTTPRLYGDHSVASQPNFTSAQQEQAPTTTGSVSITADTARAALKQNPQAYGQFSARIQQAAASKDEKVLAAELYKLQQDPDFRAQFLK